MAVCDKHCVQYMVLSKQLPKSVLDKKNVFWSFYLQKASLFPVHGTVQLIIQISAEWKTNI